MAKYTGHTYLESLMQRKIFRLDCEKMGIAFNYNEWVKAQDTNRFMHKSRIKFFKGIKTAPHMHILSSQNFRYEWNNETQEGFYPSGQCGVDSSIQGRYRNKLKNHVASVGRDIFEEELQECDCADEAMTRMIDRLNSMGFGGQVQRAPHGGADANADITSSVMTIEDYCTDGRYRQHFKDDLKCSQAASIYFQKTVNVEERELFWPPGQTTLKLKGKYLLGCAAVHVSKFAPRDPGEATPQGAAVARIRTCSTDERVLSKTGM